MHFYKVIKQHVFCVVPVTQNRPDHKIICYIQEIDSSVTVNHILTSDDTYIQAKKIYEIIACQDFTGKRVPVTS